jgi:hypothetical protein
MATKPHATCSMQHPNDQTEAKKLDVGQAQEGLPSIPRRMVCHSECAKLMRIDVEANLEEQTHVISISTYTFYFKSQPVDDIVSKPRSVCSERDQDLEKRLFDCEICSKRFKHPRMLKMHRRVVHSGGTSVT